MKAVLYLRGDIILIISGLAYFTKCNGLHVGPLSGKPQDPTRLFSIGK